MQNEHVPGSRATTTETATRPHRPGPQHITEAQILVTALPWILGTTPGQAKAAKGRISTLIHHVAPLLHTGWTAEPIKASLDTTAGIAAAADAAAQQRRWRLALQRSKFDAPASTAR